MSSTFIILRVCRLVLIGINGSSVKFTYKLIIARDVNYLNFRRVNPSGKPYIKSYSDFCDMAKTRTGVSKNPDNLFLEAQIALFHD